MHMYAPLILGMTRDERRQFSEEHVWEWGVEFDWRLFWELYGR